MRVALDQLGPFVQPGLGDVAAPGLALRGVVLERDDAAAEDPRAGGEPDRRVAARAADLEHLAPGLRRDEREQEAPGGRRHRARPQRLFDPACPLVRVLRRKAIEHGAHAVVEHAANRYEIGALLRV